MLRRAVSPVVGVVLIVAVTVALAAVVGAFATGVGDTGNAPEAAITADMETGERYGNPKIVLTHASGDELDVRDLTVRVFVGGKPLEHQPDVPFFSETGFISGPDGVFHNNADKTWTAGEQTSLTIAGSNAPQPNPDSQVTVKIYAEGEPVATART